MLRLGVTGKLTDDQIMAALNDPTTMKSIVDAAKSYEASDAALRAKQTDVQNTGTATTTPAANPGATNIGAISVNVSGFISDEKTAQRIAALVQAEITKRQNRAGK